MKPVLICGGGICGLVLAQYFRKHNVPYRLFERDADLTTRGVGWGLTIHWSLPQLREILPAEICARLSECNVDYEAVREGRPTRFPFFDLATGELKAATPPATEAQRVRVSRERLRNLLATDIDIEWNKSLHNFYDSRLGVRAVFEDGTSAEGCLLVACDGLNSRARSLLWPSEELYTLPIGVLGVKAEYTAEQMEALRVLDPYFLQGCSSQNDSFGYFSMLESPGNPGNTKGKYVLQVLMSWPYRPGFLDHPEALAPPEAQKERLALMKSIASTWADPFRSLITELPPDTDVKRIVLRDWVPPRGLRSRGRVILMGDAMHPMTMYRGEGVNHAIVDVYNFIKTVAEPLLLPTVRSSSSAPGSPSRSSSPSAGIVSLQRLRRACHAYEDMVVRRARAAVLAARYACLEAHEWDKITPSSALLSRRSMFLSVDPTTDRVSVA